MYFSIRDDETPASIAQLHGVDVRSLIDLNKQRFPDLRPRSKLPKGSSLKLPCDSNDWTLAHHWVGAGVRDQSNGIGEIFQACAIKHDGETTEDVRFRARYDTLEIELSWMEARTQILEWLRTDKPEETLLQVLFECFEFWKFREHQEELIKTVLNGGDLLCVASTGFGKSLLYQLPGLFVHLRSNKCVLVISPLIALMEDQVARLNSKSLKRGASEVAAFIGSAQTDPFVEPRAKAGEFALVYATPEKLFFPGSTFLSDIRERLAFVVIDEAHCISEWGHDFRPEFSELSKLRHHQWLLCPKVPIIAVTATAKRDVRDHICDVLNLRSPTIKVLPIYRHNLRLHCFDRIDTSILNEVYDRLRNFDSAIIYTSKRKKAEELCQKLKEEGILADFYHAGMSAAERSAAQQRFMNNETTAICATTAFGMGIDKSDVRLVVHWTAPKNFDAYIQEIGRGGRDGKPAECWMIAQGSDFTNWENDHYRPRYGDSRDNFMVGVESLRTYFHSVDKCRWAQIISYSEGEESARSQLPNGCGFCDNCTARSGGKTEHRDFAAVAVLLLWAIDVCLQKSHARRCRCHNPSEYGVTKGLLETALGNPYSKTTSSNLELAMHELCRIRYDSSSKIRWSRDRTLLLLPQIAAAGLIVRHSYEYRPGFKEGWDVSDMWNLTPKGRHWLESSGVKQRTSSWVRGLSPLMLPVPQSLRDTCLCLPAGCITEDWQCEICGNKESTDSNPILLCDATGCNRGFHVRCLRLDGVPEGEWFCLTCEAAYLRKESRVPPLEHESQITGDKCSCCQEPCDNPIGMCSACIDALPMPFEGDDDIPMPFEDADVVEDEGGVPISVPAREICDSETVPMVVDIDGKKIIMDIDDAENPTQPGGAEPTPTPMAIDDDLNPTRVGGSKRRRVITDSDDDDNHSSRFARRTWDSNAEAIVSEHWEHVRRSADAEIVAIDEKWARVPFVLRFALLVVGVEERHVSVDLLNDLLELSSVTPPNFRECERRMQQLHQEIRVLRPPQGKTIMYEAELSSIGTWQYAMYIHGDTIAHSELGAENILKVVVPDLPYNDVEKHQTLLAQKSNLSTHKLFGRNFVFFGIKSDHSMVNSRAFLIAEQSRGPGLVWNSADEARQLLADFRQVQANPAKMSKRMEHAFSKTFRALADFNLIEVDEPNGVSILNAVEYLRRQPPVPDNEVHVIVMDDTYGSGLDAKGNTAIMTDGNGLISSNLSSTFPQVSSGQCIGDPDEAVLVTQYRQWLGGSLDKGTLTTDARLPPGWIVIPKSSRKISGSKDCSARERGISRFEINNTFDFSTRARLNVNLIQLLEHLARRPEEMRAYLLRLQQKEVERVRTVADHRASRAERIRTIRNLQGNAFRRGVTDHASPATLLLAGFEPSKEPFLQKSLAKYEIDELKSIREGKINLPYSYNLVGVCDPSGSLPAGTVCVVVEGVAIGQSMVGSTTDVPKVVIYRAPGCTEGDLREVEHRKTPELMQVLEGLPAPRCNAIFFSSHGNRSLADEMAGGDLDGDIFVVIADPNIVGNVHTKDAWRADRVAMDRNVQRAAKKTSASTGSELVDHFLKIRHSTCSTVGSCANQLLAVADLHGLSHPDAATLGTVYYHALDGEITEAPKLSLSLKQWPCWMESRTNRTGITFVRTNSILSDMWCTNLGCDSERDGESMPRDDERTTFHVDRDLDLSRDVHTGDKRSIHDFERLVKKWKKLRKDYGHRMQRLLSAHGVTDSDSVSAAALDAVFDDEAKAKISELYQFYRQILFDAHTSADEEDFFPVIVANKQSLLFEASALFVASYAISSSTVGAKQSGGLQFPWRVAGDLLCELKCIRMAQRQGSSSSYHFNPQSLQALLGGRS